ncbi:MAG TPA: hypothetical protein VF592_08000 [Sphingomonas sp.]|jgi:hypothetical protein|uniref:hypothetical protein n=1 Tax=Sphingomonas sp. TaxID=28214 RepID=UPI002ED9C8E8
MTITTDRAPAWLRVLAVVLILWGVAGCYACLQQFRLGANAMGPASAADRALHAGLPGWYGPLYATATITGLLGAIALLIRSRLAMPLFTASLVAAVVQFGHIFAATDLIARKGVAATVPFPLFVIAVAAGAALLSRHAIRRRWIA